MHSYSSMSVLMVIYCPCSANQWLMIILPFLSLLLPGWPNLRNEKISAALRSFTDRRVGLPI